MSISGADSPEAHRVRRLFLRLFPLLFVAAVAGYFLVRGIVLSGTERAAFDADRLLRSGKLDEARDRVASILFFDEDNPHAQLILAKCSKQSSLLSEAIENLEALYPDSPVSKEAGILLAFSLLEDRQLEKAEKVLEEYLAQYPDSREAAEELRWLYFNQYRPRDVQRLLEERIQSDYEPIDNLIHLMMTEFRPPVPREGIDYLARVNEAQPGQTPVMRALAYCRWQLGEIEEAYELYENLLRESPRDNPILLDVAAMALEHNQLNVAEESLQRISVKEESQPDDRTDWLRSLIEERNGEMKASLVSVGRAIEKRPYELKYHYHRATLLQRMDQQDEAEAAFQHARRLEALERQQAEIVLSGAMQTLDSPLCQQIADCYEQRGRFEIASRWRELAKQFSRGEL